MILQWRVTERCNLACAFCAYDRRVTRTRRDARVESIEKFGRTLSDYQNVTGDRVMVSWIGGEPFLFPGLTTLTLLFKRDFSFRISATTNGTALSSQSLREHIVENYDELTISVDGVGTTHDNLRGWRGGYETLHKAIVDLAERKHLKQTGLLLRVNVVLMHQTLPSFDDLCLELANWGVNEITFNQLGGRDRPEFYPRNRLLPEDAWKLGSGFDLLRERLARRGVLLAGGSDYLNRIQATSDNVRLPVFDCNPGQQQLFIDEDGLISPCHFSTSGYGLPISELHSVESLIQLPDRFRRLQATQQLLACQDCHSTHVFSKFVA